MKILYIRPFLIIIIFCLIGFSSNYSYGQLGWQWGISSQPAHNFGFETWAASTIDDSGNVVVAGNPNNPGPAPGVDSFTVYGTDTLYNTGFNLGQLVVAKADSTGHFIWARGSQNGNCMPLSVTTDIHGNIYVLGTYFGIDSCSFDAITLLKPASYYAMYCIVKYSPAGDVIWAKNISGYFELPYRAAGSIGVDGANNIYVTGYFDFPAITIGGTTLMNSSPLGDTLDVFIAKYDPFGNPLWAKSFGGHQSDYPAAMTVTQGGNIYISGSYESRSMIVGSDTLTNTLVSGPAYYPLTFFVKMDSSGNFVHAETLNSAITISGLTCDAFENIYMVGGVNSSVILGHDTLTDIGNTDLFLAKYDSSGNIMWANSAGSISDDKGWSITLDKCNDNLWVSGTSSLSATMNFNGNIVVMPAGGASSFFAEYNDSGIYLSSIAIFCGEDDYTNILSDNRGSMYIVGDYTNTSMIFGPDTLANTYSSSYEELLIAKYRYGCPFLPLDTVYVHADTVVCGSSDTSNITLTVSVGTNYRWYDGATTQAHVFSSSGIYWASIIDTPYLIVDTFHVTFVHTSPPCATITGINNNSGSFTANISIYPNPAHTQITIKSTNRLINQISITNLFGQTLYSKNNYNSEEVEVTVADLPAGMYLIRINGTEVRNFVKQY